MPGTRPATSCGGTAIQRRARDVGRYLACHRDYTTFRQTCHVQVKRWTVRLTYFSVILGGICLDSLQSYWCENKHFQLPGFIPDRPRLWASFVLLSLPAYVLLLVDEYCQFFATAHSLELSWREKTRKGLSSAQQDHSTSVYLTFVLPTRRA